MLCSLSDVKWPLYQHVLIALSPEYTDTTSITFYFLGNKLETVTDFLQLLFLLPYKEGQIQWSAIFWLHSQAVYMCERYNPEQCICVKSLMRVPWDGRIWVKRKTGLNRIDAKYFAWDASRFWVTSDSDWPSGFLRMTLIDLIIFSS